MSEVEGDTQETLRYHAINAHEARAAVLGMVKKITRRRDFKRGRECFAFNRTSLCFAIIWQAIEALGDKDTRPDLLKALTHHLGYAEARRLIDEDEKEMREFEEMAREASEGGE
jgi:hypothetical protein